MPERHNTNHARNHAKTGKIYFLFVFVKFTVNGNFGTVFVFVTFTKPRLSNLSASILPSNPRYLIGKVRQYPAAIPPDGRWKNSDSFGKKNCGKISFRGWPAVSCLLNPGILLLSIHKDDRTKR